MRMIFFLAVVALFGCSKEPDAKPTPQIPIEELTADGCISIFEKVDGQTYIETAGENVKVSNFGIKEFTFTVNYVDASRDDISITFESAQCVDGGERLRYYNSEGASLKVTYQDDYMVSMALDKGDGKLYGFAHSF